MTVAQGPRTIDVDTIATLAEAIDAELDAVAAGWSALAADERAMTLLRLAGTAPRVAQLLCPGWGRFGRQAAGKPPRNAASGS